MLSSIFNGSYWWGREDGKYGWWISRDQPWYSSTLTDQTPGTVDDYLQTNPDTLLLTQIKLQVQLMIIYRPTLILFYSPRSNLRYSWWISTDQPWYSFTLTDQTPGRVNEYLETNPDILLLSQIKLQVQLMIIYRPTLIFFYSHRSNFR